MATGSAGVTHAVGHRRMEKKKRRGVELAVSTPGDREEVWEEAEEGEEEEAEEEEEEEEEREEVGKEEGSSETPPLELHGF